MDGTVADFDERRGLGRIVADGRTYDFHCTALVDGSRAVEVGTEVRFEVRPAGRGRWEATHITKP